MDAFLGRFPQDGKFYFAKMKESILQVRWASWSRINTDPAHGLGRQAETLEEAVERIVAGVGQ